MFKKCLLLPTLFFILSACATTWEKNFDESFSLYPKLHKHESSTFAGSYVTDKSCYCTVFLFTDSPKVRLERYTNNPDFIAKKTEHSLVKLREVLAQTEKQATALGKRHWRKWGAGIDMKNNRISLEVWDVDEANEIFDKNGIELHPLVTLKWISIDEV